MLQPSNRLTLTEAMRPPVGFRFESAMAVTYTLNLQALLAVPAALALATPSEGANDGSTYEPVELLHGLRTHAGSLTVFCQAGETGLPPSRRVFAFLERALVPVVAPRHGIVHPKVWVLRYEAADQPPGESHKRRLRVLVASRNLTFDESWDTTIRLDESAHGGVLLTPVGELFEDLLEAAVSSVSQQHRRRVQSLSVALQNARFALPEGVDDLHVHVLGLSDTASPLPTTARRSLIISPFVSDDFFTSVHATGIDELVSRPEGLDRLKPDSLSRVAKVYAFDDGSAPDFTPQEDRLSRSDPGRPLVGLHAKVFSFEDDDRARLFLGSANATAAAFGNNVELLVELVGSVEKLGIDRLCEGSGDERGLRSLFNPYTRLNEGLDERGASPTLDGLRHSIARLAFAGTVEQSGDGWAVTYRSDQPMPARESIEIRCWPLATEGHRRPVAGGERLQARFEASLEAVSGLLAFELVDEDGALTQFVVPVPLEGVPEHRDRFLLRVLIGNAERFLRYLLALLDEQSRETDIAVIVERVGESGDADGTGGMTLPVLEKLLRTMRNDPGKLAGLHPLVSDLAHDDALPRGFAELWEMIHELATAEAAARGAVQ